jgi:hypothetical protein
LLIASLLIAKKCREGAFRSNSSTTASPIGKTARGPAEAGGPIIPEFKHPVGRFALGDGLFAPPPVPLHRHGRASTFTR